MRVSNKHANTILRQPPQSLVEELVVQKVGDELLIYNMQTNQAMCLNQTAALVWENCDGKSSVSEIAQKLAKELGTSVNDELVLFAVSELNEKGLIEKGEGISDRFKGLSRREIVKKVGFASLVALPIVSSIVAPKAAAAQTPAARTPVVRRNCYGTGRLIGTCQAPDVPSERVQELCVDACRRHGRASVFPTLPRCCSTNAVPVECAGGTCRCRCT